MAWLVVRAETFEFGFWYLCVGVCLRVCFLTCFWVMLGVVGFRGWGLDFVGLYGGLFGLNACYGGFSCYDLVVFLGCACGLGFVGKLLLVLFDCLSGGLRVVFCDLTCVDRCGCCG